MTFGSGPEGTETQRRTTACATGVVGKVWAEVGTALVVLGYRIRTSVRKVAGATDKSERVVGTGEAHTCHHVDPAAAK